MADVTFGYRLTSIVGAVAIIRADWDLSESHFEDVHPEVIKEVCSLLKNADDSMKEVLDLLLCDKRSS